MADDDTNAGVTWPYDIIFGIHTVFVLWNLLTGLAAGVRHLLPGVADALGAAVMLITLGAWIPALWLSPVIIVGSLWFWRDWRVLIAALLLALYVVTLQRVDSDVFLYTAAVYTAVVAPLCCLWFCRARKRRRSNT